MNTVKTLSLSAALLMAGGTLSLAHAGGVVSDITTQTADVSFASTGTATVSLTAKAGLTAASYRTGDVIATGTATASAGTVAYRWTPGTGTVSQADKLSKVIKITGAGSKENVIDLTLTGNAAEKTDGGSGWIVPTGSSISSQNLTVSMAQDEVVSPDTYTLSVDAVVWGS
ncbi:hypothetical protein [Yokenella regensburgei]|uniref:hypothetical protein n=1 Tax=Yokenella regensburgei TaxID=158877 RepID=UPI003EDA0B3E